MPRRRGEDEDDMTMWQMRTMTRKRKIMTMRTKITAAAVGESIRRRDGTGRSFSIWRHKFLYTLLSCEEDEEEEGDGGGFLFLVCLVDGF
ncbi:hypothetical protein Pint_36495 [Pistacia integerrima]|uniref:Uncharacterized protein n=1 Tax=Pistacia integerrima TaxID=434235 RepID=A0ACC0Y4S3_9ROSI|nr:hypothetical protein Pint_36495 [Pistacia integerrima]